VFVLLTLKIEERLRFFQREPPPRGVLLEGPPGTGKSSLIEEIVRNLSPFVVNVSKELAAGDFKNPSKGLPEKMVNQLADRAERIPWQLCVLMIDEVESLVGSRRRGEESSSVLSVLLSRVDGIRDRFENLCIFAATNYVDKIDAALLRRLKKKVFVGIPNPKARREWFEKLNEDSPHRKQIDLLVQLTMNFSPASLQELIANLNYNPRSRSIEVVGRMMRQEGFTLSGYQISEILGPPVLQETTYLEDAMQSEKKDEKVRDVWNHCSGHVLACLKPGEARIILKKHKKNMDQLQQRTFHKIEDMKERLIQTKAFIRGLIEDISTVVKELNCFNDILGAECDAICGLCQAYSFFDSDIDISLSHMGYFWPLLDTESGKMLEEIITDRIRKETYEQLIDSPFEISSEYFDKNGQGFYCTKFVLGKGMSLEQRRREICSLFVEKSIRKKVLPIPNKIKEEYSIKDELISLDLIKAVKSFLIYFSPQ